MQEEVSIYGGYDSFMIIRVRTETSFSNGYLDIMKRTVLCVPLG